jgi:phosphoglycerol geranylgeranyltransferase
MRPDGMKVIEYIRNNSQAGHVILIDPDDQSPEVAAQRCIAAVSAGSRLIFVGGSTGTNDGNVNETCQAIQESLELCLWNSSQDTDSDESKWQVPVVLFPAAASALSGAADAITFMMLMNSHERAFLVGEQVKGAPLVKTAGIEPLSMGYLVCSPGGLVGEVGRAELFAADDTDEIAAYAMCAESFGFDILYLEAGSGAEMPVSEALIKAARAAVPEMILFVGGGIRDGESASRAIRAGADWIVTGNLTESFENAATLETALISLIEKIQSI